MIEFTPVAPAVLTDIEASLFLRLHDGDDANAVKRLNRIVDKGLLRPALIGNHRRYSVKELQRYIDTVTERYSDLEA